MSSAELPSPSHRRTVTDLAGTPTPSSVGDVEDNALVLRSCAANLANGRNASRQRGWLLPGCAADALRVDREISVSSLGWSRGDASCALIWADIWREEPKSAYVAVTEYRLQHRSFHYHPADRIRNAASAELGHKRGGGGMRLQAGGWYGLGKSSPEHCMLDDEGGLHEHP
jgi:hypothetical protein